MTTTETIAQFLAVEIFGEPSAIPAADDDLLTHHPIDSIGVMLLVTFLQEEFGIVVPAEDVTIENFRSVSSIARYVERRKD